MSASTAVQNYDFLDEEFEKEPEAGVQADLPDDDYLFRVDAVEIIDPRNNPGRYLLKQELIVVDGEYDGTKVTRFGGFEAGQGLGFTKKDLHTYGIDIYAPGFKLGQFLSSGLGDLLDRVVKGAVKHKLDKNGENRMNTYLNEWVGMWDPKSNEVVYNEAGGPAATASTPAAKDPTDPFSAE